MKQNVNDNKVVFKQISSMVLITILTQVFQMVRTSIVASKFGIGNSIDAVNFINSMSTFIFSFIGAGITTVLIPYLVKGDNRKSINIFISYIYSIVFFIILVIFFNKELVLRIISGRTGEFIVIASKITISTMLAQFFYAILGVTDAVFQCNDKFNIPKIIKLLTSILLVVLLIIDKNLSIYSYTNYILIVAIITLLINFIFVRKTKFKFRFNFNYKNETFKDMVKIFLPTLLSTGLYQVVLITDTLITSRLGEGQISILNYSTTIISMVNTLLLANVMLYVYPKIAENNDEHEKRRKLFQYLILILAIMILVVVGFFIVGKEGLIILYQRGKFDSNSTTLVYVCICIYMLGIPTNAIRDLFYKYFYSNKDTVTPLKNSVVAGTLNLIFSIILSIKFGIFGIVVGTIMTSYISLTLIIIKFIKKFGFEFNKKSLIRDLIKIIVAGITTILIVKIIKSKLIINMVLLNTLIFSALTISIYIGVLYLIKSSVFSLKLK